MYCYHIAHALSGRTFVCVPGVNQFANLPAFLEQMKGLGTEYIYEAYDMDKILKTECSGMQEAFTDMP